MQDMALRRELQQLSPEELRALLSSTGHGDLLREDNPVASQVDEQLIAAKDEGNAFFRQGKIQDAVDAYSRCIAMDPNNTVCLSNRAAAYLKLGQFDCAIADCSKAIEVAPTIKPFMRRATAYIAVQQFENAVADLIAALEFEPRNKECRMKLQTIVDVAMKMQSSWGDNAKAALRRAGIRAAVIVSVRDGWTQSAVRGNPGPAAVNGHTLFEGDDGHVYLFGGRAVREQKPSVFVRDKEDDSSWGTAVVKGDIPTPRSYHTAHVIDEFLFVVGGRTADSEDDSVYMLDTNTSEWFKVPIPKDHALTPRAWHSSILTNAGKLFVLGGGTYHGPLKDAATLDLTYFQTKAVRLNSAKCAWH
ncbi:hypothetical protein BBJ29_005042 [Phytophthora kernoviae]|uniref:Uncharacterized protein n=1 Tax=Phytophthora kernoviae TaxID=325452 RepID=A0A3F2RJY3_9STRA|nr:hypothetical protein BBJ29_005042 [Phytophthora kernoviae]RLN58667.1 hypothetical protein BBP00_00006884 [Phytophthora kernoviae]